MVVILYNAHYIMVYSWPHQGVTFLLPFYYVGNWYFIDIPYLAKNIIKNYPGVVALNDVNFNVYKGKVNVLVGENGAGKSTLMKILSGVEKQTSGNISLNNKNLEINSTKDAEEN